jgi:hypothetical protein
MLLLCGETLLCPHQITQQQRLIFLSIQALFMVINRAHQQAAKSISLSQDLGTFFLVLFRRTDFVSGQISGFLFLFLLAVGG